MDILARSRWDVMDHLMSPEVRSVGNKKFPKDSPEGTGKQWEVNGRPGLVSRSSGFIEAR